MFAVLSVERHRISKLGCACTPPTGCRPPGDPSTRSHPCPRGRAKRGAEDVAIGPTGIQLGATGPDRATKHPTIYRSEARPSRLQPEAYTTPGVIPTSPALARRGAFAGLYHRIGVFPALWTRGQAAGS